MTSPFDVGRARAGRAGRASKSGNRTGPSSRPPPCARVLRPGGLALVAVPHEDHLRELRADLPLLAIDADKPGRVRLALGSAFEDDGSDLLHYPVTLAAREVSDLLRMTPNCWHVDDAVFAAAGSAARTITFAVHLLRFRRVA